MRSAIFEQTRHYSTLLYISNCLQAGCQYFIQRVLVTLTHVLFNDGSAANAIGKQRANHRLQLELFVTIAWRRDTRKKGLKAVYH